MPGTVPGLPLAEPQSADVYSGLLQGSQEHLFFHVFLSTTTRYGSNLIGHVPVARPAQSIHKACTCLHFCLTSHRPTGQN